MHSVLPTNCDPRKLLTPDKLRVYVYMDITATHPQSLNKKTNKKNLSCGASWTHFSTHVLKLGAASFSKLSAVIYHQHDVIPP